ncbi:MAG: AAA family ATPase [Xanthomonadales bacterium]|nr:AAA family ATPase [Gammaproteobacteria bacterium]MBT8055215.1 AAA family ATPase [Gammaproteobacteria bacterium]NNK51913.1 AAA family ATPase [Xanthomonadales bacterium]
MARILRKLKKFFREIWRRRVFQVAIPYTLGGWVLVQVAEIVLEAFEAPPIAMQGLLILLVLGFPVAIILAWIFDITPRGSVIRTAPIVEGPLDEPEPEPSVSLEMGASERRQITILSCVFEFTDGLDSEMDPEYLQSYYSALKSFSSQLADRYKGYMLPSGTQNLVMAFGYPHADEGDAQRAVAAGLALIEDIRNKPEFTSPSGEPALTVRVGVATGLVIVDESRTDGNEVAIIGQVPRLATWLTGLANPGFMVVGPQTQQLVDSRFQLQSLGIQKQAPSGGEITVYRVEMALTTKDFFAANPQMTGRDDEMRMLGDRWQNVLEGDGQVVFLRGEAGIGKSSLVNAFYRTVIEGDRVVVIPCQCSPYERHNPLSPLIQVLQGPVLRFTEQDTSAARLQKLKSFMQRQSIDTSEAVALLANLLSLDTGEEFAPPSVAAQVVRLQTLELLLDMISLAASRRPVLMILEDLHWADPTTLEMVRMMMDRGTFPGLFVLFSARPEFQADWTRRAFVVVHELLPLGLKDARELINSTEGGEKLPDTVVDRIISETDGNPLYLQELTRAILESKAWQKSLEKGGPDTMNRLEIPTTLQDSLASRVDNLGKAKALLQLCSVLGREFSYDLLKIVSGTKNEAALKEELSRIVKAEMLFQRGLFRNLTYTFKHILIQETAYNSLLKSKRRELHGRIARILKKEIPDVTVRQPALLAHHYSEAGDLENGNAYWIRAGRQSLARFANEEAVAQSRNGLSMLKAMPDSPQRAALEIPLRSILGTALLSTHGYAHPEVRKTFTRALELCEFIGDAPQLFRVAVGLWMYYTIASQLDEALDLSQRLVRIAETTGDPVQYLQAQYCLAFTLYYRADFLAAKSHLEHALASEVEGSDYSSESPSGDDTRIHVRVILAHVNWHLGDPRSGPGLVREANRIALEQKHPWGIVFAAFQSAWYHQMRSEPEKTLSYANEAIQIATEKGFGFWLPLSSLVGGWAESRLSDAGSKPIDDSGAEKMKTALERYRQMGSGAGVTYCSFMLAEEYSLLGRYHEAAEQLESGWAFSRETGENFFEPEYYRLHGQIKLENYRQTGESDLLEEAANYLKQALRRARRLESRALELRAAPYRAEALSLQGKDDLAIRILRQITERAANFAQTTDWKLATKTLNKLEKTTGSQ